MFCPVGTCDSQTTTTATTYTEGAEAQITKSGTPTFSTGAISSKIDTPLLGENSSYMPGMGLGSL